MFFILFCFVFVLFCFVFVFALFFVYFDVDLFFFLLFFCFVLMCFDVCLFVFFFICQLQPAQSTPHYPHSKEKEHLLCIHLDQPLDHVDLHSMSPLS